MTDFAIRLKQIRLDAGKSRQEVTAAIGVYLRNYQTWELGEVQPGFESLIALSDFFNVDIDYLIGLHDQQTVSPRTLLPKEQIIAHFSWRLKSIRKAHKKNQHDTAVAIGVTLRTYQNWEYDHMKPSFDKLIALAKFFGMTVDDLMGCNALHETNSFKIAEAPVAYSTDTKRAQLIEKLHTADEDIVEKVFHYIKYLEWEKQYPAGD